jgi:hypothetical protein
MKDLEAVVYGRMTSFEFLCKNPPSNKKYDYTLQLHPEGYVCYTVEGEMFGLPVVDYNKLKLAAYYIGHKFKEDLIPKLKELSETASDIFPLAKIVGEFYSKLETNLYNISSILREELTKSEDTNEYFKKLTSDQKTAYSKPGIPIDKKIGMILNSDSSVHDWILSVVIQYYPSIATTELNLNPNKNAEEVKGNLKKLCFDLKPWLEETSSNPRIPSCKSTRDAIIQDFVKYPGVKSLLIMMINQKKPDESKMLNDADESNE